MNNKQILLEFNLPEIVQAFETRFGDWIWQTEKNFSPNRFYVKDIFKIFNKYIFNNMLDENVPILFKSRDEMKNMLGAFVFGYRYGKPVKIFILKTEQKCNFCSFACTIAHEMIHMYDYCHGPLHFLFEQFKYITLEDTPRTQIVTPAMCRYPRYDLHGGFFEDYMDKINEYGFCVDKTYNINKNYIMRRIDIKENDNTNIFNNFLNTLGTNDHKQYMFIDKDTWFFEIS